jgi:predicted deacetylase
MSGARYIFRLDDITPTMDWNRFWATLNLLRRHRVKPLLGVVPDNRDPKLNCDVANPKFWETMGTLLNDGVVDIAQHGHQHLLGPKPGAAILRRAHGATTDRSEFAGFPYSEQLSRLTIGKEILRKNGIDTPYFFAPNHSFDANTVKALKAAGFTAVSDGVSLYPYRREALTFIPQQMWSPRKMSTGVFTICLHTNEIRPKELGAIRRFLRMPVTCSSFKAEVEYFRDSMFIRATNPLFWSAYSGMRSIKRSLTQHRKQLHRSFPTDRLGHPGAGLHAPSGEW